MDQVRVISLILCLALFAAGPVPLSACVMPSEMPMECPPPPVKQMDCEGMDHADLAATLVPGKPACCYLSAPVQDAVAVAKESAKSELPETSGGEDPIVTGTTHSDIPSFPFPESPGTLERQARLCVFLI